MRLFTIILNETELNIVNAPDYRILEEIEADRSQLLVKADGWFETEKEALDYMIDGQELY